MLCFAQEKAVTYPTIPPIIVSTTAPATEVEAVYLTPVPTDPFLASRIPLNSKIYIAPFKSEDATKPVEGFETYMAAALRKRGVPLIMVADRSQADFEIEGSADKKGAAWAKKFLLGDFRRSASASPNGDESALALLRTPMLLIVRRLTKACDRLLRSWRST